MSLRPLLLLVIGLIFSDFALAQQERVTVTAIPDGIWSNMQGKSWRANLPCPRREELALLSVPYRDFSGRAQRGLLIVARSVAGDVAAALQEIFDSGQFRIAKMRLIDDYGGSDDASMADNNTSGFNCRLVEGSGGLSKHARGMAIDINPIQNPYRDSKGVAPPAGRAFDEPRERKRGVVGLITKGDVVTRRSRVSAGPGAATFATPRITSISRGDHGASTGVRAALPHQRFWSTDSGPRRMRAAR